MNIAINLTTWVIRISVIAGWCAILSTSTSAQHQSRHRARVMVEIVSIPYESEAIVAISPKRLVTQDDEFRLLIKDEGAGRSITDMLDSVRIDTTTKFGHWVDARVVCLIHRENRHVDTVSFGDYLMQINGRVGYLQPIPLLTLAQYLPKPHSDDIWHYIDGWSRMSPNIPKYGYKKEDNK